MSERRMLRYEVEVNDRPQAIALQGLVLHVAGLYPAYGSQVWPLGSPDSGFPLHLDHIVEACEGPFQNESNLRSPYRRI